MKKSWYSLKMTFLFALFTSPLHIPPFPAPLPEMKPPSPAHLNARQTTPLVSKCPQQEDLDKRAVISLHGSTSPIIIIDYNVSGRTIVPQDSWEPCQCLSFTNLNIFVLTWLQGLLKLLSSWSDVASHDSKSNFFGKSETHCTVTILMVAMADLKLKMVLLWIIICTLSCHAISCKFSRNSRPVAEEGCIASNILHCF